MIQFCTVNLVAGGLKILIVRRFRNMMLISYLDGISATVFMVSPELDNFDGPDAQVYGAVIDTE